MPRFPWNDEQVRLLRELAGQGFPEAAIAERIGGITRAAVRLKARRLEISLRHIRQFGKAGGGSAKPAAIGRRQDHDDFGSNESKIMNVIS